MDSERILISIYGPTMSSKTGLAVNLAKYIWGKYNREVELINADSRKVYKDINIGQVSINSPFNKKIDVKLTKLISLNRKFGLYEYKKLADEIIENAYKERKIPILFGGTGIYHLAVTQNWVISKDYDKDIDNAKSFGRRKYKYKTLFLITDYNEYSLKKAIHRHVKLNIQKGIFKELKELVDVYNLDYIHRDVFNILYETTEYKEYLDYCRRNGKQLKALNKKDLSIITQKIEKDLLNMAKQQIALLKKWPRYIKVRSWKEAQKQVDGLLIDL